MTDMKVISSAEVKKHKDEKNGVWMVIHNDVYDVTSFLEEHPGGEQSLLDAAGKDSTQDFEDVGHSDDARELMKKYLIGTLPPEEKNEAGTASKCNIPCCPHLLRTTEKSWRTYDGSHSSRSSQPHKSEYKPSTVPRPEGRVNSIYVPKERPRRRPCDSRICEEPPPSSNLKWAIIALAGALVFGIVLKKYLIK